MTNETTEQVILSLREIEQVLNIIRIKRQILLDSYEHILKPKKVLPSPCITCELLHQETIVKTIKNEDKK